MATEDRLVSWNRSRKRYLLAGSKCNQHSCQIGHLATGFQRNSRCAGWVLRFKLIQSVRTSVCGAYADHVLIIRWSFADHVLHKPHPKPERWRASRSAAHWSNYTMEWILLNQRWKGWKRLKGGYFCGPKWWPPSLGTKSKSLQKIPCFIIFFGDRCFTMPQHATTFVALNDLYRRAIATWFRQQTDTCTLSSTFKNWAFRMQRNVGLSQMITRYHK